MSIALRLFLSQVAAVIITAILTLGGIALHTLGR